MDTTGFEFENSGFEIVSDDLLQCIYCASLLIFVHHIDATHSLHEHRSYKIWSVFKVSSGCRHG